MSRYTHAHSPPPSSSIRSSSFQAHHYTIFQQAAKVPPAEGTLPALGPPRRRGPPRIITQALSALLARSPAPSLNFLSRHGGLPPVAHWPVTGATASPSFPPALSPPLHPDDRQQLFGRWSHRLLITNLVVLSSSLGSFASEQAADRRFPTTRRGI
jgi:hypothetical protein